MIFHHLTPSSFLAYPECLTEAGVCGHGSVLTRIDALMSLARPVPSKL
jgi:hypothetical protein